LYILQKSLKNSHFAIFQKLKPIIQESLANAKVSTCRQCMYEGP